MGYDVRDTIAAISSATGGAARGIVRLSGPRAVDCVVACFESHDAANKFDRPTCARGVIHSAGIDGDASLPIPGALYLWPNARSFTREPAAEFHTIGSPPLLAAVLDELCRHGARPAEPGEFTLRAFLAGRIDLTQAEAVLGVVDAGSRDDLDAALDQLAGGLSRPLQIVRERLLSVLAELEAGLDFADEPIEFIGRQELLARIDEGRDVIEVTIDQLSERGREDALPRVLLTGLPNVGKSSLFNALAERFGVDGPVRSLVSPVPGATRDYVSARLRLDGIECELIDAAGDDVTAKGEIQQAAQQATATQHRRADLQVLCIEHLLSPKRRGDLVVVTKSDLQTPSHVATWIEKLDGDCNVIVCSSVTGDGVEDLAMAIRRQIAIAGGESNARAATAARCLESLREADRALDLAAPMCGQGNDELLAAEIRLALQAVGEVVGVVCADDVLDRVFSQFCIGK